MAFLGFFNFALTCFDILAWPLFALGYPLCASIRAIETNSNYHMRKLVAYWILFSLISLLELAFVKLIERIPLWPYIKLGTICWLVLPRFNGAHYCYKSFIQPCLSVNLEEATRKLYKRQKTSVEKDNFLSVAKRYVTENGTDFLEKLVASKGSRTGFGVGDIKAVAEAEKRGMPSMVKQPNLLHLKGPGTGFGVEETKTVAEAEEKEMPQMVKVLFKANEMTKQPVRPAATDKVLKEWTCSICQVTTSCEANLISHLTGKKHRAKCEELKSKTTKQTTKHKASPFQSASKKYRNTESTNLKSWCPYCSITCTSENNFVAHLNGKKHKARVQEMAVYPAGVQG